MHTNRAFPRGSICATALTLAALGTATACAGPDPVIPLAATALGPQPPTGVTDTGDPTDPPAVDPASVFGAAGPGPAVVVGGAHAPDLQVDPLVPGANVALVADGAPPYAELVFVVGRIGVPNCPAFLDGGCVNLGQPRELGRLYADVDGHASITVPLDAAAAEGQWYVFQAAVPEPAGWVSPVVLRRTDAEGMPSLDYADPFEPNTRAPARIVPGRLYSLAIRVNGSFEDEWADWFTVEAPPNRTLAWTIDFHDPSGYWGVVGGGPDASFGEVITAQPGRWEIRTSAWQGGDHQLMIESGEYGMPDSVYDLRVEVQPGPVRDWWPDADRDGHGDLAYAAVAAVDPPAPGWVAVGDDCDDGDPAFHPGAPEVCGDGIAQGCVVDRPCGPAAGLAAPVGDVGTTIHGGPQFGIGVLTGGDLDGDGIAELVVGDSPGVSLFAGPIGGDMDETRASAYAFGHRNDAFELAAAVVGDVNGDGIDDLAVGGNGVDAGFDLTGGVGVLYGPVVGDRDLYAAPVRLTGVTERDFAGSVVAGMGDLNGDGRADLLVGTLTGEAYVVRSPMPALMRLDRAALAIRASLGGPIGAVSAAGDVDGDGVTDISAVSGADVVVFDGASTGAVGTGEARQRITGVPLAGWLGAVAAGDVDGDGLDDLVGAGAPGASDVGFVFTGLAAGGALVTAADATFTSVDAAVFDGEWVRGAGDLDRDGFADLVLASTGSSGNTPGRVHVATGPIAGFVAIEGLTSVFGVAPERITATAAGVGDVDGDGFGDLAIAVDRSISLPWAPLFQRDVVVVSGADL